MMNVRSRIGGYALAALACAAVAISACGGGTRSESHAPPDTTAAPPPTLASWLTPAARDTIEHGSLRPWYEAQRAVFPDLDIGAFVLSGESGLGAYDVASTLEEQLGPIPDRQRLLVPSPGGRWLLDPLYGLELVEENGRLIDAWDADHGFRIFDSRTDSMVVYAAWGTDAGAWMGAWADGDTFVLVGKTLSFQPSGQTPPYGPESYPAVWIGNMALSELRSFRGPTIPDSLRSTYSERRISAMRARYPGVEWRL